MWQEKTGCSSKIKIISLIFNCHFLRSKRNIFIVISQNARSWSKSTKIPLLVCLQLYRLKQSWSNTEITKTNLTMLATNAFVEIWKIELSLLWSYTCAGRRFQKPRACLFLKRGTLVGFAFHFWMFLGSTGRCITVVPWGFLNVLFKCANQNKFLFST